MSGLRKLLPLADRVLVRRLAPVTQTAGGIYIPETNTSKNMEGEVLAVGPGRTTESGSVVPVSVSVGDKVLMPEYGGQTIKVDGEELSLLRDDDILGKWKD